MKYKVEITETLKKVVEVDAETPSQAKEIVRGKYYNDELILDSDNHTDTDFWVYEQI